MNKTSSSCLYPANKLPKSILIDSTLISKHQGKNCLWVSPSPLPFVSAQKTALQLTRLLKILLADILTQRLKNFRDVKNNSRLAPPGWLLQPTACLTRVNCCHQPLFLWCLACTTEGRQENPWGQWSFNGPMMSSCMQEANLSKRGICSREI